jgi:hypothetical protein
MKRSQKQETVASIQLKEQERERKSVETMKLMNQRISNKDVSGSLHEFLYTSYFTDEYIKDCKIKGISKQEAFANCERFVHDIVDYIYGPSERERQEAEYEQTRKEFEEQHKPKSQREKTREANRKHRNEVKRREQYEQAVAAAEEERQNRRKQKKSSK